MTLRFRTKRLEAKASGGRCPTCGDNPRCSRWTFVGSDESTPAFPGPDAPQVCTCGREIAYHHLIIGFPEPCHDDKRGSITGPRGLLALLTRPPGEEWELGERGNAQARRIAAPRSVHGQSTGSTNLSPGVAVEGACAPSQAEGYAAAIKGETAVSQTPDSKAFAPR